MVYKLSVTHTSTWPKNGHASQLLTDKRHVAKKFAQLLLPYVGLEWYWYWVLGNIHSYWVVLVLGDIFCCSDTQYNTNQTGSQHRPHASEQLFSSACDFYSGSCNRLSGHHADTLTFIKHNQSIIVIIVVLELFMVIPMLYTRISIGIGYWYH